MPAKSGLESLPVELLYEIQLHALSYALPLASRYFNQVYGSASSTYRARYVLAQCQASGWIDRSSIFTKALRYPFCSQGVLEAIQRILSERPRFILGEKCELPRRIFRQLRQTPGSEWSFSDYPIPLLQFLYNTRDIPVPDTNSHHGYALTKAVQARFIPLIQFLLAQGASPSFKNDLAVMVAIRHKDLSLVKMLIERRDDVSMHSPGSRTTKAKKRRLEERVAVNPPMLKAAVRCGAKDIVKYLVQDKGVVPDMETLQIMTK